MKKVVMTAAVLFVLLVIGISWYISGLNRIVFLHEGVQEEWSQVETQLQRRNDLIPNLVNIVKGYAAHEKGIFAEVTKLRSQWQEAQNRQAKIETANKITDALSKLLLVVENYPELKASENFLTLQSQLEGTKNGIAVARRTYNEKVRNFNTYIKTVFGSFFAKRRNLDKPEVYFEAEESAREVPEVKF